MAQKRLLQTLTNIGLTEKEARVYLASLSQGPSTILKLAEATNLKRTTIYSVIESLKQKGLMSVELSGWKKRFTAMDPQALSLTLKQREQSFETVLPEFISLHNLKSDGGTFRYYEGIESVKAVYEGLLRDVAPGSDYLIISDIGAWLEVDEKWSADFRERRAATPVKMRLLTQDSEAARHYRKYAQNFNAQVKLLPEQTMLKTNAVIIPQRLVIHQMRPPVMAIVIENESIIQMQRQLFEIIWTSLPNT